VTSRGRVCAFFGNNPERLQTVLTAARCGSLGGVEVEAAVVSEQVVMVPLMTSRDYLGVLGIAQRGKDTCFPRSHTRKFCGRREEQESGTAVIRSTGIHHGDRVYLLYEL
jgi:hypothetical protein